ncbi:CYFA0S05e02421g1_1 [Cyberlindnera fabianii]|uniref:CYFA0S05e02421g1_1 n=1 Tax=Cyberlindnera fabianii TaxID=36022 RepID=A0A061ATW0_CYBFA|nr:CYFA0S05e02421g1_1 [Cyberlindnera fabianii]
MEVEKNGCHSTKRMTLRSSQSQRSDTTKGSFMVLYVIGPGFHVEDLPSGVLPSVLPVYLDQDCIFFHLPHASTCQKPNSDGPLQLSQNVDVDDRGWGRDILIGSHHPYQWRSPMRLDGYSGVLVPRITTRPPKGPAYNGRYSPQWILRR